MDPKNINRRPASARPAPAATITLSPRDVYLIIRRHLWLIIIATFLGIAIGGSLWYVLREIAPRYTAATYIEVLPPIQEDPMRIGAGNINNTDILYNHRRSIASLINRQSRLQALLNREKVQETEWFKKLGKNTGERLEKGFKDLQKNFSAYAQRETSFVVVSMTCGNSEESAAIVNEMVSMFLDMHGGTKRDDITKKLTALKAQKKSIQTDLNYGRQALAEIRQKSGYNELEAQEFRDTLTVRLDNLEIQRNNLVLELQQIQTVVDNLTRQATGPISEQEQVKQQIESDPTMIILAQRLALQESALAGLMAKFGENHREVRQTRELIQEIRVKREDRKAEIAEQTRQSNLQDAKDHVTVLASRLDQLSKLREEAIRKKEQLIQDRALYEERMQATDELQERLNKIEDLIAGYNISQDDPDAAKVRSMGLAPKPTEMSSPKWQLYFPGGTMLGMMFGIGLAFLIEFLNDIVRTPRDVIRHLNIQLLGVIPHAQEDPGARGKDLAQIGREAPYSIITESYRRLRANLNLSKAAEGSKVLLVTSGNAGDGKTSTAVNLANSLVAEGKKVLLIDANFWRPAIHKIFPHTDAQSAGLSTLLTRNNSPEQVIRQTGLEGLDVIDAGPLLPNPGELLSGSDMEMLIKEQREKYDYVLFDGPPILLVSDTKMLARLVDANLVVFNAETTRRGVAQRTIRELREVDANIAGCTLFAVRAMKGGYFKEQFKSHQEYQRQMPQMA